MSRLRAIRRSVIIVSVTGVSALSLVVSLPLKRVARRGQLRFRNAVFRFWGRVVSRTMGARVRVEGQPPAGAFFLVTNHQSYIDIPLLGSIVDAAFVAKADLRAWPLMGRAFQVADTIFIDRGRRRDVLRVMERMESSLERSLGVVLFPEGTTSDGSQVLRFKPSLLELPARQEAPVRYASISYRTATGAPSTRDAVCWFGNAPFGPHFWQLVQLEHFEATVRFGPEPIAAGERKALADRLHHAISASFADGSQTEQVGGA